MQVVLKFLPLRWPVFAVAAAATANPQQGGHCGRKFSPRALCVRMCVCGLCITCTLATTSDVLFSLSPPLLGVVCPRVNFFFFYLFFLEANSRWPPRARPVPPLSENARREARLWREMTGHQGCMMLLLLLLPLSLCVCRWARLKRRRSSCGHAVSPSTMPPSHISSG